MIRGQRFELDLEGDDGDAKQQRAATLPGAFVADVLERKPKAVVPPTAPQLKGSRTGFPEHRRRNVESRFRQQQSEDDKTRSSLQPDQKQRIAQDVGNPAELPAGGTTKTWEEDEKQRVDEENRQKLSQMSTGEIEQERRELLDSLSPVMIQRLLQRSNIDSGSAEADLSSQPAAPQTRAKVTDAPKKSVSFAEPDTTAVNGNEVHRGSEPGEVQIESATEDVLPQHDSIHFPRPQQPPNLDPSSETFLEDLHEKYFPSLPSDPDKLEWMQSSTKNSYDPSASGLDPKELRFSFKGELIPPRTASQIPVSAGLHHHGDAPEAAGYTISELVHLGHSSFAPQRCIAFQTLGRLLYRLGKGEFGDSGEPGEGTEGSEETFGALARGIWREVDRENVIAMLLMESEGNGVDGGRHVSAKAYATEAVWLWQRGGGRSWKAE